MMSFKPNVCSLVRVVAWLAYVPILLGSQGCTGLANSQLADGTFGTKIIVNDGDAQTKLPKQVFDKKVSVQVLSTLTGEPIHDTLVNFRVTSSEARLVDGDPSVLQATSTDFTSLAQTASKATDYAGVASIGVVAPDSYSQVITIEASVEGTTAKTTFTLYSSTFDKCRAYNGYTTHYNAEINENREVAGEPFEFTIECVDDNQQIDKNVNEVQDIIFTIISHKSWGGKKPQYQLVPGNSASATELLPYGVTIKCTFVKGVCHTSNAFTLVDSLQPTLFLLQDGSPSSSGNPGPAPQARPIFVDSNVDFGLMLADKTNGPLGEDGEIDRLNPEDDANSDNAVALTENNLKYPSNKQPSNQSTWRTYEPVPEVTDTNKFTLRTFNGVIVDKAGNWKRDLDASADGVVWSVTASTPKDVNVRPAVSADDVMGGTKTFDGTSNPALFNPYKTGTAKLTLESSALPGASVIKTITVYRGDADHLLLQLSTTSSLNGIIDTTIPQSATFEALAGTKYYAFITARDYNENLLTEGAVSGADSYSGNNFTSTFYMTGVDVAPGPASINGKQLDAIKGCATASWAISSDPGNPVVSKCAGRDPDSTNSLGAYSATNDAGGTMSFSNGIAGAVASFIVNDIRGTSPKLYAKVTDSSGVWPTLTLASGASGVVAASSQTIHMSTDGSKKIFLFPFDPYARDLTSTTTALPGGWSLGGNGRASDLSHAFDTQGTNIELNTPAGTAAPKLYYPGIVDGGGNLITDAGMLSSVVWTASGTLGPQEPVSHGYIGATDSCTTAPALGTDPQTIITTTPTSPHPCIVRFSVLDGWGQVRATATPSGGGSSVSSYFNFSVMAGNLDHFKIEVEGGLNDATAIATNNFRLKITGLDHDNNTAALSGSQQLIFTVSGTPQSSPIPTSVSPVPTAVAPKFISSSTKTIVFVDGVGYLATYDGAVAASNGSNLLLLPNAADSGNIIVSVAQSGNPSIQSQTLAIGIVPGAIVNAKLEYVSGKEPSGGPALVTVSGGSETVSTDEMSTRTYQMGGYDSYWNRKATLKASWSGSIISGAGAPFIQIGPAAPYIPTSADSFAVNFRLPSATPVQLVATADDNHALTHTLNFTITAGLLDRISIERVGAVPSQEVAGETFEMRMRLLNSDGAPLNVSGDFQVSLSISDNSAIPAPYGTTANLSTAANLDNATVPGTVTLHFCNGIYADSNCNEIHWVVTPQKAVSTQRWIVDYGGKTGMYQKKVEPSPLNHHLYFANYQSLVNSVGTTMSLPTRTDGKYAIYVKDKYGNTVIPGSNATNNTDASKSVTFTLPSTAGTWQNKIDISAATLGGTYDLSGTIDTASPNYSVTGTLSNGFATVTFASRYAGTFYPNSATSSASNGCATVANNNATSFSQACADATAVTGGVATSVSFTANPSIGAKKVGTDIGTFTAIVRDADGNAVPNQVVSLKIRQVGSTTPENIIGTGNKTSPTAISTQTTPNTNPTTGLVSFSGLTYVTNDSTRQMEIYASINSDSIKSSAVGPFTFVPGDSVWWYALGNGETVSTDGAKTRGGAAANATCGQAYNMSIKTLDMAGNYASSLPTGTTTGAIFAYTDQGLTLRTLTTVDTAMVSGIRNTLANGSAGLDSPYSITPLRAGGTVKLYISNNASPYIPSGAVTVLANAGGPARLQRGDGNAVTEPAINTLGSGGTLSVVCGTTASPCTTTTHQSSTYKFSNTGCHDVTIGGVWLDTRSDCGSANKTLQTLNHLSIVAGTDCTGAFAVNRYCSVTVDFDPTGMDHYEQAQAFLCINNDTDGVRSAFKVNASISN